MSAETPGPLLAVPNVSEGADAARVGDLREAFGGEAAVLDTHSDALHGRSVFTIAAAADSLGAHLLAGARRCLELIDLREHAGEHPAIGALDVCPVVYPDPERRRAATDLALELGPLLAEQDLPVFLYGELAAAPDRRERHHFRKGGPAALAERMSSGELQPDFGPGAPHPSAGAVLLSARPPLAAFNVELEGTDLEGGREIAARLRESGGGPVGVRAIAIDLGGRVQISTNVHDPVAVPLARVVTEITRLAGPSGARPVAAELIGLVPEATLEGYPEAVPILDFDAAERTIEARLAS